MVWSLRRPVAALLVVTLAVTLVGLFPAKSEASFLGELAKFVVGVVVGVIASWEAEPLQEYYEDFKETWRDANAAYQEFLHENDLLPVPGCSSNRCPYYF